MGLHDVALSSLEFCGYCLAFQVEYSSRAINAYKDYLADEVFPWVIGCNVLVKLLLEIFPDLSKWPANIQIYVATAVDVLACYLALLRVNLNYLSLAIFPFTAISFICVLCLRHNRLSGDAAQSSRTDNGKKAASTKIPEKFNTTALLAPHFALCVFGMLGDADHDGNNYDISYFFLFLICMLLDLTIMMVRLPAGISRGIEPASEMLYKASLVVMLLTAHVVAVDAFGKEVVLLLLPEVVPLLLWFSLHLDRRTPIINVRKLTESEHFVLMPVIVAICGYLVLVPKVESLFFKIYWVGKSCAASGAITYVVVLVLRLWPEKVGMATLSSQDAPKLLMFWGSILLKAAVGLFAFGGLVQVNRWSPTVFSQ
uniref:Uncharacterized protein n=1 Tax=Avena sativa TaxID=4498 RepID=A0ACD5Z7F6_AVESA